MRKFACAVVFGVLLAPLAQAAPTGQGPAGPGGPAMAGGPGGGREIGIARALELTPDQQTKWQAERDRQRGVIIPLQEKLGTQIKELKDLLDRKASDDAIKAKIAEVKATRGAIRDAQDKHEANLEAILTPTQQARFTLSYADEFRRGGFGRPPMNAGRGPGGVPRPR